MKNSFKYSILLLFLSFLIATLCCNSHLLFENYASYPFVDNYEEKNYSIENLQEALFKYNNIVSDSQKTGAIDYDISKIVNEIKDERIERERIQYSKLLDTQPTFGNYMPFESRILSDKFKMKKEPEKIKGEKIIIDPTQTPETLPAQSLDPQVEGGLGTIQGIQERSITGDFYHEPNSCIGEWSDWNRDNCGSERERCGIMFKRYQILEREINDENGPGKPCDFNDGIIKYKYCYGDNADDYESNMERCGMSTNHCPCKLNDESSIILDGENIYDLEDEDCLFELERDCICPKGYTSLNTSEICKLTAGVDCSIEEPGCIYTPSTSSTQEKCEIPTFLSKKDEDDFYKNYTSINGKCQKKECTCSNGKEISNERCIIDGLELCDEKIPCDEGYYMSGSPPTCKKQTEGTSVYKECSCLYGSPRIEDATSMRCNPSNTIFSNLNKIRQMCNSTGCQEGYELVTGTSDEKELKCNNYYPNDFFDNINCCIPKYDTCLLEETELEEKNITRKNKSNKYNLLNSKTINQLKEEHNGIDEVVDIDAEDLFDQEDPKQYLINKIINLSDDEEVEETCNNNISIKQCYGDFKCKPGYSFLPSTGYSHENELRIVSCETRNNEGIENICYPLTNCLGQNVESLSFDGINNRFSATIGEGEQPCKFSSNVTLEEIRDASTRNEINNFPTNDNDVTNFLNSIKCGDVEGTNTCSSDADTLPGCFFKQIQTHYPTWNGTCVPVSCNISDEIKNVYNIQYDNCSSGDINCGLTNVSCKSSDYEVPNSRKILYCPSPQKVDSSYLTNQYEIINIGCSSNPPEPSDAETIRRERMASAGEIISEDAEEQASQRQAPDEDNIGESADFTGSTSDLQYDFELGLEEQRIEAEEDLEERSNSLASMGTR
tara:strand:- start:6508 stop:9186 length:2679 start_codon:yes stop_codon:yes gene_type:complete